MEEKLKSVFQNPERTRKIQKIVCFTKDEAQLLIPEKAIKECGYIVTPDATDSTISNPVVSFHIHVLAMPRIPHKLLFLIF